MRKKRTKFSENRVKKSVKRVDLKIGGKVALRNSGRSLRTPLYIGDCKKRGKRLEYEVRIVFISIWKGLLMKRREVKRRPGKAGMIFFVCLGIIAFFVVNYNRIIMEEKYLAVSEKLKSAEMMRDHELRRKEELENLKVDVKTRKFIEDTAREKFGLTYENEIIFEPAKE